MRVIAWLGLGGVAVGIACLGSACSSSGAPGDKYPAVGDFCKALATAECQEASICGVDATLCASVREQDCLGKAQMAQGEGRNYVPGAAPDCVDEATGIFAKNPIDTASIPFAEAELNASAEFKDKCAAVFAGSVDNGGACQTDGQCKDGRICDKQHCGDKTVKKGGDFCGNPGEVCDTGFYCTSAGGNPFSCTAKLTTNQPCNATAPCVESDRCVSGVCEPKQPTGSLCATDDDCTSGYCDVYDGFICVQSIVFAPAEKALCGALSTPGATIPDAGSAPVDSGSSSGGGDAASE